MPVRVGVSPLMSARNGRSAMSDAALLLRPDTAELLVKVPVGSLAVMAAVKNNVASATHRK